MNGQLPVLKLTRKPSSKRKHTHPQRQDQALREEGREQERKASNYVRASCVPVEVPHG